MNAPSAPVSVQNVPLRNKRLAVDTDDTEAGGGRGDE